MEQQTVALKGMPVSYTPPPPSPQPVQFINWGGGGKCSNTGAA